MRLDNAEVRRETLARHADHREWIDGPYISFTTSPKAIESMALLRTARRGPQYLTVIDPNRRIRNGLPVLDVEAEMKYYGILDPYRRGGEYYKDHYACLWMVTDAEVVGHWEWTELKRNPNWYEQVITPAFDRVKVVPNAAHLVFGNWTAAQKRAWGFI